MAVIDLLTPENQSGTAAAYEPQDAWDIAGQGLVPTALNAPIGLRSVWEDNQTSERDAILQKRFGKKADDFTGRETKVMDIVEDISTFGVSRNKRNKIYDDGFDSIIMNNRKSDPANWNDIKTQAEMKAEIDALGRSEEREFARATENATSGGAALGGQLLAGLSGVISDPINLATLPFGASASAGILRAMGTEFLLNSAIELAEVPAHAEWAGRMGRKYGFGEAALDVGLAGAGAAGLTGLIRGAGAGIRKSMNVLDNLSRNPRLTSEQRAASAYASRQAHVDEEIPDAFLSKREADKKYPPVSDADIEANRLNMSENQNAFREYREPDFSTGKGVEMDARLNAPELANSRLPPRPPDIIDFIVEQGGLRTDDPVMGDITAMDMKAANKGNFGRILNKNGRLFDEMREAAEEAGYLPPDSTVADFLAAINRNSDKRVYSIKDADKAEAYNDAVRSAKGNEIVDGELEFVFRRAQEMGVTGLSTKNYRTITEQYLKRVSDDPETTIDEVIGDYMEQMAMREVNDNDAYVPSIIDRPITLEQAQSSIEALEKIDMLATQEAKFAALVKEMPDEVDPLTGQKLSDILDELKEDQQVADAVRTCSIQ